MKSEITFTFFISIAHLLIIYLFENSINFPSCVVITTFLAEFAPKIKYTIKNDKIIYLFLRWIFNDKDARIGNTYMTRITLASPKKRSYDRDLRIFTG